MSPLKKITIGFFLFALGWTGQQYYADRIMYVSDMALEKLSVNADIAAQVAIDTQEDELTIALERAQGAKANQKDMEEAEENIGKVLRKLRKADETIEAQVDAEIKTLKAQAGYLNGAKGMISATALSIFLQFIGMVLALIGCLSVIRSNESKKLLRVCAMVIALIGTHSMLQPNQLVTSAIDAYKISSIPSFLNPLTSMGAEVEPSIRYQDTRYEVREPTPYEIEDGGKTDY